MIKLEVDGKTVEVENGATVMEAANKLGIFVPHFCYHKKLSIAANCRMCLVQVEKAPKPLPACATPATEGMKVMTDSVLAKTAQAVFIARVVFVSVKRSPESWSSAWRVAANIRKSFHLSVSLSIPSCQAT